MGRNPRYIPPNSLQHVTDVTFQNRRFLRPSKEVNERLIGIWGRAQKKYDMTICAVVAMSTHIHYLLQPKDGAQLAAFMCFVKTNIAKEIGNRLLGWAGTFFDDRYHLTPVSEEDFDQIKVLQYLFAHGVKELLVDTVEQWPGVHSAIPSLEGKDLVGKWFDRTAESNAKRRSEANTDPEAFASEERVVISPLPCMRHLPAAFWQKLVGEWIEDIDREAKVIRRDLKKRSLGVARILAVDPESRADHVEKSPKPRFHARDPAVFRAMFAIWQEVIRSFREASELLRSGLRSVSFPEGTFPPSLPFVQFSLDHAYPTERGQPS